MFGAGQVGMPLAERFLGTRKRARREAYCGRGSTWSEVLLGDAADAAFCHEAVKGATAVFHCMNPPYDTSIWAALVPRYMDNVIETAGNAGAGLVVLDNLYMLGRTGGRSPWTRTRH